MAAVAMAKEKTVEFDFESYLSSKKKSLIEALEKVIPQNPPPEKYTHETLIKLHKAMRDYLLNDNKRNHLPSVLCIAACELVGGSEEAVMPVACAMAMIKTVSVIHHELVMDMIDFRWKVIENSQLERKATDTLAGYALLARAFEHIATAMKVENDEMTVRLIRELGRATGSPEGVAGLQAIEVVERAGNRLVEDYPDIEVRIFECSAVLGAMVGGGSDVQIEKIRPFGRCVGCISQKVDHQMAVGRFSPRTPKYEKKYALESVQEAKQRMLVSGPGCYDGEKLAPLFDVEKGAPLFAVAAYIASELEEKRRLK